MFRVVTSPPSCRVQSVGALLIAAATFLPACPASADVILGAIAGTINSGGLGFGSLAHTFDQSGLSSNYLSGVTDLDAYLGLAPSHGSDFQLFEWFSDLGTSEASVTYDLGAVHTIGRIALWNEDASGIGLLSLYGSTDGIGFSPVALNLAPTNNPIDNPYRADVFGIGSAVLRYIRFDMSECPQPGPDAAPACSIGEVAFAESAGVAEPAAIALLGLGLTAVAVLRRRRRRAGH